MRHNFLYSIYYLNLCITTFEFNSELVLFFYLTDIHIESVTHSAPESFGHVIVKEQITTSYHQENYCDVTGQKEQVNRIGASATESISLESSTISTELSSEIMEECLATNLGTQSSLRSSTDQEIQVMSPVQSSGLQVKYLLEQDASHTLYSIREDHSLVSKNTTLEREDDHQSQILVVDKPVLDCYSNTTKASEEVVSPKEEAQSVDEKHGLINRPCEGLLSTEDTAGDAQSRASVNSGPTGDPISCTENSIPEVDISPVNVVNTSFPIKLPLYMENGVSKTTWNRNSPEMSPDVLSFDASHQSHSSQSQCSSETNCSNVPPLFGSSGTLNSVSMEGKEVPNNDMSVSSLPQTSPPCRTATNNLPTFNNERPASLPNVRGRSFSPWNTSNLSAQRYFKELVFVFHLPQRRLYKEIYHGSRNKGEYTH